MNLHRHLPEALKVATESVAWPEPSAPLLVAVSGGPDSSALLLALARLTPHPLHVAHVDHGLRPDSAEDGHRVAALAASLGVGCTILRLDSPPRHETAAREARHAALANLARARGIPAIAFGHHADDQAETLLWRLIRGTTPDGLAGMAVVAPGPGGVTALRPLLSCTRRTIGQWWANQEMPESPSIDPTNLDPDHTPRNRIRLEIAPVLERLQPRWVDALWRLTHRMSEDRDALHQWAKQAVAQLSTPEGLEATGLAALPTAVRRRVLALRFGGLDTLSQERLLVWMDRGCPGHLHLSGHVAWHRNGQLCVLSPMAETLASCRLCLTPPSPRPSMPEGQSPPDLRVS